MNRFPREVQFDIFSQLVFQDKLQCALACREWYVKITSVGLYSKIELKYPQCDNRAKTKIKSMRNEGLGLQVLDLHMEKMDNPLELSLVFPNLKSLQVGKWQCKEWNDKDIASILQNWKKAEVVHETYTDSLLTNKKFDASLYMASLTFLSIHFARQEQKAIQTFIEQLKNSPALEHLRLEHIFDLNCQRLDLLHENTPNLKHLELKDVDLLFSEEGGSLKEYRPLPMNSFVASTLRSFSVTFMSENTKLRHYREENSVRWIEYVCRKYTNLINITIHELAKLESQHYKDIMIGHLKKAFCKWARLRRFDVRPVYYSTNLVQAMDAYNICLNALHVYIYDQEAGKQFISLANSKQISIKTLTVHIKTKTWTGQRYLFYLLWLLKERNCQLKTIDIRVDKRYDSCNNYYNILIPNELLGYLPSLQGLIMPWVGTDESSHAIIKQATQLTHIDLDVCQQYNNTTWKKCTWLHIQDIVCRSPLLQSFSIVLDSNNIVFDFQQNPELKYFKCLAQLGDTFRIIQNNQAKLYTYCKAENDPNKRVIKGEANVPWDISLYLPPNIPSLSIDIIECPFKNRNIALSPYQVRSLFTLYT